MVSVCSFIYLVCELYGNLIWSVTFSKCQVLEFIAVNSHIYGNLEKKKYATQVKINVLKWGMCNNAILDSTKVNSS